MELSNYHSYFLIYLSATTVYDKANLSAFKPMKEEEKNIFYEKLEKEILKEKFISNL